MKILPFPHNLLGAGFFLWVTLAFSHNINAGIHLPCDDSRDLGITHTVSHEIVTSDAVVALIISLFNHDELAARDIQIRLNLPDSIIVEAVNAEYGEFLENQGIWNIQLLDGGNGVTLHLRLLNLSKGDQFFSASIIKAQPQSDPILHNNVTRGIIQVPADNRMVVFSEYTDEAGIPSSSLIIEDIKDHPNNVLSIYDRYGYLVFEQEGYDNSWKGNRHPRFTRYGWDELPSGTYYYVLSFPMTERLDISGRIDLEN